MFKRPVNGPSLLPDWLLLPGEQILAAGKSGNKLAGAVFFTPKRMLLESSRIGSPRPFLATPYSVIRLYEIRPYPNNWVLYTSIADQPLDESFAMLAQTVHFGGDSEAAIAAYTAVATALATMS